MYRSYLIAFILCIAQYASLLSATYGVSHVILLIYCTMKISVYSHVILDKN